MRIELGALEQMEQQVERAFVNRQPETDAGVGTEFRRRARFVFVLVAHSCTIQEIAPSAMFMTG